MSFTPQIKKKPLKQMIDELNDYYEKAKAIEEQRHINKMNLLTETHSERMNKIRNQEAEYLKNVSDIRAKYARQKERMIKNHDHQMRLLMNAPLPNKHINIEDLKVDDDYIEAVGFELRKLLRQSQKNNSSITLSKLRDVSNELDAFLR